MPGLEDQIRDQLVTRLGLIEPGLKFLESNYHLRNPSGADGFVDILAKDSSGLIVVIELKRADSTARQALHEISKYTALLASQRGVPVSGLRALVVSTTWHELLVPLS